MFKSFAALLLLKFTFFKAFKIISYSASILAPFKVVSDITRGISVASSLAAVGCCCCGVMVVGKAEVSGCSNCSLSWCEISNGRELASIVSLSVNNVALYYVFQLTQIAIPDIVSKYIFHLGAKTFYIFA